MISDDGICECFVLDFMISLSLLFSVGLLSSTFICSVKNSGHKKKIQAVFSDFTPFSFSEINDQRIHVSEGRRLLLVAKGVC